jgi:hypothetical protein
MKAGRIHNFGGPLFSRGTQLSLWNLSHDSRASTRIAEKLSFAQFESYMFHRRSR